MNAQLQNPIGVPLDKLSRPVHDLRVSVIEACNFRCPYCMPADKTPDDAILQNAARLSFEQIEKDSDRDNWMKAEDAKAYGLIDEVLYRI